ncbi:MAG TPA: ECF-type sigma factor [Planctomycetaceae bacterium]
MNSGDFQNYFGSRWLSVAAGRSVGAYGLSCNSDQEIAMTPEAARPAELDFNTARSVCSFVAALEGGDESAANSLWRYYYPSLVRYFRQWYGTRARPARDEEDLALEVLAHVCQTVREGGLVDVASGNRLSRTVFRIARNTLFDQQSSDRCQKRGGGCVRSATQAELAAVEDDCEPVDCTTEDEAEAEFNDFLRCELERHPLFWPIVMCRLHSGLSVEDTARVLHKSESTVRRNLSEMHRMWVEYESLSEPAKRARAALAREKREADALEQRRALGYVT